LGVGTFTGGQQALCWQQQQPHQPQQLEGVDEGLIQTSSAVMAPGELQGEEMLVYGKYLQLPLRGSNSAVCVSGFASAGVGAGSGGVTAHSRRHKRPSSQQHQGVAVMVGLSVAAG
jgi:hypothetical protein